MVWTDFENQLKNSINYSLIDENKYEGGSYSPKILINNPDINQFVLTDIQQELTDSVSFSFSVAFVTKSGIALLKSQLSDLNSKGNRGRILISPYLDFNDPLALKELLKLKNVDVRVSPSDMQLHSKFYLFEQGKKQVLISGSSNLTGNALKKNYEWNIKLTSTDNGHLIRASKEEFNRIWQLSSALTYEWIEKYKAQRSQMLKLALIDDEKQVAFTTKIEPNEMQRNALDGLNEVRKNGAKKAIVVSATGTGKTFLSAFDVQQHNRIYFELFKDVIESGLWINKKYSEILTIGQKYSRRDVLKLLNFEKDNTPQNIGGYIVDKAVGVCPIFITYHKADDISDTIKYEDEFLSDSILTWYSKSGRKLTSPDVQTIISSVNGDITLPLFVKKDDGEGSDFYYLGNMKYIESSAEQKVIADKPIVKMNFHLENSVDKSLFEYLTH